MRVVVEALELVGTSRRVEFTPGLNIISGEITSGKSSLMELIRGVFGSSFDRLIPEVRTRVRAVQARIILGDKPFTIIRRPVSTAEALVDVAGSEEVLRLPVSDPTQKTVSYGDWLLRKLELPTTVVPVAPGRADSQLSPVTINDYFLYCHLRWAEIDTTLLGSSDRFKDQKRRAVFEIVYGLYDAATAEVRENLRLATLRLSELRAQVANLDTFFANTAFENRAALVEAVAKTKAELHALEMDGPRDVQHEESVESSTAQELRHKVIELDQIIAEKRAAVESELRSIDQLRELENQLRTQARRLTKAIVADTYLLDFDFVRCPRCNADVASARATDGVCYLCLQSPASDVNREDLEKEQMRLDAQLREVEELVSRRETTVQQLRRSLEEQQLARGNAAGDLDYLTRSYVSDAAQTIADRAAHRAGLASELRRYSDFLQTLDRLDAVRGTAAEQELLVDKLRARLDAKGAQHTGAGKRIGRLEETFRAILEAFETPKLGGSDDVFINRSTYAPVVWGRPFDQLHSPGIMVQTNVAHALAHQLTAIEMGLPLPNLLMIDGLTSNIGTEGLDADRKHRMYDYLVRICSKLGDKLQVIVADNDVPSDAERFVRVHLSVDDRLVPENLLGA